MTVRVRYAPSPTGIPHVGNIRTALFDWLYARHQGGTFILRIEDTDRKRYDPRALDAIYETLRWLGLDWDEGPDVGGDYGPYFQSQRLDLYQRYARELIERGHGYECFCSPERLDQVRAQQQARKQPPRYDRFCRDLSDADRAAKRAEGLTPVVRFRTPDEGTTAYGDVVRGTVAFENATLDDFVMMKSDGFPTGVYSHVIDDHLMEITHVMRAEEWVSTTPRQILVYEALGWTPPLYAHLSIILGPDKAKLAKRHGAVSALDYRDQGYLPEALFNFLGLLGWSLDDHTVIISREQFVEHFSLERLVKNPAVFDLEKLTWMNGVYIREHVSEDRLVDLLVERLDGDLPPGVPRPIDRPTVAKVAPLIRERMQTLADAAPMVEGFFVEELSYAAADLLGKKFRDNAAGALDALRAAAERVEARASWDHESLEQTLRALAEELGVKPGDLFMLLRVAVTGKPVSPPLFETMEVLGRDRCIARLAAALDVLAAAHTR
jgi:glutamyl-tRNA synthetase